MINQSLLVSDSAPEVVDLYELSPMQQGMLFHTLHGSVASAYFEQRYCLISGNLQAAAFRQAWQLAVDRHSILRTSFHWQEAEKPLQVVYDRATLPWHEQDWQHLGAVEQQRQLEKLLADDRSQGFDLAAPPLMRCYLIQVAPQRWQFVWSHHHLLMDGWCNGILLQQVLADYDSLRQGFSNSTVASSTATYRDYITWLQQQDQAAAKSYWQAMLSQLEDPVNRLSRSYNAPTPYASSIAHLSQTFDASFTQSLQSFAKNHRLTLSTIFQGALALLLAQSGDRDHVLFGLTVAGRPPTIPGIQQTIGLFINTLPVTIQLAPDRLLVDWLQAIQTSQLERDRYSYSALAEIQSWANCPAGSSLFDCLLVVENYPVSLQDLLGRISHTLQSELEITQPQGFAATNYPIVVTVLPGETLQLAIEYHTDKFDPACIQTFLEALGTYLKQFLESSQQTLLQIHANGQWQRSQPFSGEIVDLIAAFETQAAQHPERIALVQEEIQLTYQELNQQANQLAHALQEFGIQPSDRVAICHDRSPQQIIAILATLKVGAAYVPIDPTLPRDRIQYLLQDSQPRLVLGDADGKFGGQPDLANHIRSSYSTENLTIEVTGDRLAYLIYTSGTTGKPKGVMIDRLALAYFTATAVQIYGIQTSDRILQFASASFDAAVEEIFPILSIGGALVLRSTQVPMPQELWEQCRSQAITILDLPTAYWQQLIQQSQPQDIPSSLRMIIIGGEAVDPKSIAIWEKLNQPQIQVWNGYGPTEATVITTVGRLQANGAIGFPLPGKTLQILDRWQRPVPVGVVGELYIGGAGLATGYWQRLDLTVQRFIEIAGERYYRTGDRGYWQADGQIVYQGRIDSQIKLRGFRIELEEIAALLHQQPQVNQAIVILDDCPPAAPQILAYYTGNANVEQLQQALSSALPSYMLPAAIVPLQSLPLTALGKVDRQALPRPTSDIITIAKPRTLIEANLVGIWQEVLGRSAIGIHDNFFGLGGHSLSAMQLVARMQQALDLSISFTDLFTYPTIAQIATIATSSNNSERIPVADRTQPLPLSFEQQRLWVLQQLAPTDAAYNVSAVLQIDGPLDLSILHQSLLKLLGRQEILRSCVAIGDGLPTLRISTIEKFDLQELSVLQPDSDEALQSVIQKATQQPFDLTTTPLWRLQIIQRSLQQHILVIVMHHIITDGWSIDVLAREWAALYQAELESGSLLPELPIQYADYAVWQRSRDQQWQTLRDYWQQQLHNLPAIFNLPSDRPFEPSKGNAKPGKRSALFTVSPALLQDLQAVSQSQNATLFMTLLTSYGLLLHRLSGHLNDGNSLVIGTPIANRRSAQLDSLIGFFANMLPIRLDFDRSISFESLLQQVRQTSLEAYAHQDLPFEQIVDAVCVDRTLEHHPIFQVAFIFDQFSSGNPQAKFAVQNLQWQAIPVEQPTAKFDLTLMMMPTESGLQGQWEYCTDLFEEGTIAHWSQLFIQLLTEIVQDPEAAIVQYDLLPATDRQLLEQWNQTQQPYDQDGIIAAFQRQAQQSPQQTALICGTTELTYAELDRQSQQLANYLRDMGVQAGQPVAFQITRSIPAILVMLAILKVGAIYLPLDAASPDERIQAVLQESQTQWLIVESVEPSWAADLSQLHCLIWQDLATLLPTQSIAEIPLAVTAESLAYIVYTSGSTGIPKGVAVPQSGVLRLVQSCQFATLDRQTRMLQAASLAFDAATFEVWGVLLNGGTLVILPQDESPIFDLDQLLNLIVTQEITTLWLTAGLFHQLVEELAYQQRWLDLRSVTQLLAGGDVLRSSAIQALKAACPEIRVINGYGPTENTTFTCCHTIAAEDLVQTSPPIGRPIQNTQVFVLDPHLQTLSIGVPGELFVRGAGLAQGYWQRSDLTEAAFIQHPEYGRIYRTGDLVKWQRNGNLVYLGRCDRQVKIRGFRVELDEISNSILQHPSIMQAHVDLNHQDFASPLLVAYYVTSTESATLEQELKQQLQQQLPSYMQPQYWVTLPHLPLNQNGKVDRAQLPTPIVPSNSLANSSPSNSLEQKLCEIWRSILRHDDIGVHDNFFAIGGDSILAIQMVSRAQSHGITITPTQLFQAQTIAELAAMLSTTETTTPQNVEPWSGIIPLTPIQQWFFNQYSDRPHHFNQSVILETSEPLDFERLQAVWAKLLTRHDVLRSRFSLDDTQLWQQEVLAVEDYVIGNTAFHQFADSTNFVEQVNHLQTQLDITTGKLFQVAYFHNASGVDRLAIIVHHLVIDALSWRVLLEDLKYCYESPDAKILQRSQSTYRDWAIQLQTMAQSPEILGSLSHWRSQAQVDLALPKYQVSSANRVGDALTQQVKLTSVQTTQLLQSVNAAYSTKVQEILAAAIAQSIAVWTGQNQIRMDVESHGRDLAVAIDAFPLVGWFTNLFPLILEINPNSDRETILTTKETWRRSPHQGLSYGLLRYQPDSPLANSQNSQICFNYLGRVDTDQSSGFDLLSVPGINDQSPELERAYAIEITAMVRSQQLEINFAYSSEQFSKDNVGNLIALCHNALERIIQHCLNLDKVVYTPTDFDLADLQQSDLDKILAAVSFESAVEVGGVR